VLEPGGEADDRALLERVANSIQDRLSFTFNGVNRAANLMLRGHPDGHPKTMGIGSG
jgi:hypothetical protein